MDISYEKSAKSTDEWYTPPSIYSKLGHFDLDPCAPVKPLWKIADVNYNITDDGLLQEWFGRVWLNPPYSRPCLERFIEKLADHGNGIALIFNRCDCKLFQDIIFRRADAILFLKGRVRFFTPDGQQSGTPGCGSVLIAFGDNNAEILQHSGIPGKYFNI